MYDDHLDALTLLYGKLLKMNSVNNKPTQSRRKGDIIDMELVKLPTPKKEEENETK